MSRTATYTGAEPMRRHMKAVRDMADAYPRRLIQDEPRARRFPEEMVRWFLYEAWSRRTKTLVVKVDGQGQPMQLLYSEI